MRRYLLLLLAGLGAGLVGLVAMRFLPERRSEPPAVAPVQVTELALVLLAERLEPESVVVPKDQRVRLEVRNDRAAATTLVLQGYEDRFRVGPVAPGGTWLGEFVADRPGEAFAWLVDGQPVGRLTVSGSHLVEGHR